MPVILEVLVDALLLGVGALILFAFIWFFFPYADWVDERHRLMARSEPWEFEP